jgi:hypothetical protein
MTRVGVFCFAKFFKFATSVGLQIFPLFFGVDIFTSFFLGLENNLNYTRS